MKIILLLSLFFAFGAEAAQQTIPANGQTSYVTSPPFHTFQTPSVAFTPAATPTDVCTLSGSASKLVKVYKIRLSNYQTTAGINTWFVIKRSALDTTGTSVTMTATASDSFEISATAIAKYWTANPGGLGASVGTMRAVMIPANVLASAGPSYYEFDFGPTNGGKAVTLRNASENVALNFGGAALPTGLSIVCEFLWTEENP